MTQATASTSGPQEAYARNATGLVRQIGPFDAIIFNAASTTAIGVGLAASLFWVIIAFPRANILLAVVLNLVICALMWLAFALLGAVMPKVGGDYVFNGRILHPALGLAGNFAAYLAAWVAGGYFAVLFVRAGVGPTFSYIGVTTDHPWWVDTGTKLQSNGWAAALGIGLLLLCTLLALFGTKLVVKVNTACYLLSLAGVIVSTVILAFVGHDSFISHVNSFSEPYTHVPDTYNATIAAGAKDGLEYPSGPEGYSTSSTIGAMFPLLGIMLWVWWGVYMSAEMKGAGRRKRQITTILGAGFGQGLALLVAMFVFLRVVGYDFLAASNGGYYGVPVAPYYNFLAAVGVGSTTVGVILSLLLLFGFFTAVYINIAMMHRAPMAWALDGLAPKALAKVDDRTHTPSIAILLTLLVEIPVVIWAAYGSNFVVFLGLFTLFGLVTIFVTGWSALLMSRLRPVLYRGSPADWRVGGIPVLPIAGIGAIGMSLFAAIDAIHFHTNNGLNNVYLMTALPFVVIAVGIVYYFAAKAVRGSQGVDVSLAFTTIPDD